MTVLIAYTERKLQELPQKVVKEIEKKGLNINCKKTECMVVSKRNNSGDITIKQVQQFYYLRSVLTVERKCDIEIRRHIVIGKEAFQKYGIIKKQKTFVRKKKKRVLNYYITSVFLYDSECWTISSKMKRRVVIIEMYFWRKMERIQWIEHVSNDEILEKMENKLHLCFTVENFRAQNEEKLFWKFDAHRTDWRQDRWRHNELE